ncbi:MAG: hypothetical protein EXS13_08455 [Planctomycetes bacterium]|nr:hypothetical protein [Planctomycetota bacterium]
MARNVLVLARTLGPLASVAQVAKACGGEIGLVATDIELRREKISGGRIEADRDYAGAATSALDEPVFIGSAIAQLAGHCECVIVDGLEIWAARVVQRFPDDPIERAAEILSLVSVLQARMADLILVARRERAAPGAAAELLESAIAAVSRHSDSILESDGVTLQLITGSPLN